MDDLCKEHNQNLHKYIMIKSRTTLAAQISAVLGEEIITAYRNGMEQKEIGQELLKPHSPFNKYQLNTLKSVVWEYLRQNLSKEECEALWKQHSGIAARKRLKCLPTNEKKQRGKLWWTRALEKIVREAREAGSTEPEEDIIRQHYQQKSVLALAKQGLVLFSPEEKERLAELLYGDNNNDRYPENNKQWTYKYSAIAQTLNTEFHWGKDIRTHQHLQKWISKNRTSLKALYEKNKNKGRNFW